MAEAGRKMGTAAVLLLCLLQAVAAEVDEHQVVVYDMESEGQEKSSQEKTYWSPECPSQFQKYWSAQNIASVCFYVSPSKLTWWQARNACATLASYQPGCHGDLASVLNTAENDYIRGMLNDLQVYDHAWIGLDDLDYEGRFYWTDRRQGTWSNFYWGEPNNGGNTGIEEDCIELMYNNDGKWNDRPCNHQKHYACKAYCV